LFLSFFIVSRFLLWGFYWGWLFSRQGHSFCFFVGAFFGEDCWRRRGAMFGFGCAVSYATPTRVEYGAADRRTLYQFLQDGGYRELIF
jgi:hypothetical protein